MSVLVQHFYMGVVDTDNYMLACIVPETDLTPELLRDMELADGALDCACSQEVKDAIRRLGHATSRFWVPRDKIVLRTPVDRVVTIKYLATDEDFSHIDQALNFSN